jgi:hypothetical protein
MSEYVQGMWWLLSVKRVGVNPPGVARVNLPCVREMHNQPLHFGVLLCTDHENFAWTGILVTTDQITGLADGGLNANLGLEISVEMNKAECRSSSCLSWLASAE